MQQGRGSGQGCSDFIARASRALQLERVARRVKLQRLQPKASLRSTGAVARAGHAAWAILLCLRRRGLTAVTSSSKRWAAVRGHRSGRLLQFHRGRGHSAGHGFNDFKASPGSQKPPGYFIKARQFYHNQWLFPFELLQKLLWRGRRQGLERAAQL